MIPDPHFTSLSNRGKVGQLSLRSIRQMVKGYYLEAGIVDHCKTSHSLRHSEISKVSHKARLLKANQFARHENLNTIGVYVHENGRLEDPPEAYISYYEE